MSLYDRYFSKINEEHMFKLIIQIMVDETGKNIEREERFHQIFKERYPLIFTENNSEEIIDLNKLLIDDVCLRMMRIINDGVGNTPVKEEPNQSNVYVNEVVDTPVKEDRESIVLKSSKRTKDSRNRFNYSIALEGNKKLEVNKIVIPYETNTLFINDTISVRINDEEIYCQLKYKNKIDNREFFTYQPIHKKEIKKWDLEVKRKNYIIVPLNLVITRGKAKLKIGLGKSKRKYDKRVEIRNREAQRDIDRTRKANK